MNNKLRSKLLQETSQGNFKLVNSIIISERLELDDNTAAKIIIECCRIFCKTPAPTVEERDLFELLLTCKQFINKPLSDNTFLGYLQSLFFIVQFWLKQKKYELILGIENLLLSEFADCWENIKLVKAYTNLRALIHNAVVDVRGAKPQNSGEMYCQLCTLSLQMQSIYSSTNISLANTASTYFNSSLLLEAAIDSEYNCYLTVLQLIKMSAHTKTNSNLGDVFSAIIKLTDIAIRNLFKQGEFRKIREYIELTTVAVEKLSNHKIYCKLFNILYDASQIVVKLEEVQDSSELLTNNLEKCLKDIKCFSNKNAVPAELEQLFNLIYQIFFNLLEYYANVSPTIWNTFMKEHTQILICNLLGSTGKIISQVKGECRFCLKCKVKDNLYLAVSVTTLPGKLLTMSLKKQPSVSNSMCCYIFRYLECCCSFIKKMHSQVCSQWKSAWAQVGTLIYNLAAELYSMKHNECYKYFQLLIKNVLYLEGFPKSSIFKLDVLGIALQSLTHIHIRNFQFKKALMCAAIGVLVSAHPINSYKVWVTAKAKSKETNIEEDHCLQELTTVCILQLYENDIKTLYPDLNLNLAPEVKKRLLMDELAFYKQVWPSKIPMLAAFTKLSDVADILTVVKVITQTWSENLESAHDDVIKQLDEIIFRFEFEIEKNIESPPKTEEQLNLALLYAMQYYAQIKIVRQQIVDDINRTFIPEELPLDAHEMPKNPNDECDLVTSYSSLKLDEHLKIMNLLNKALTLFNICVSDCTSPILVQWLTEQNVFPVIVKIAHEFRLHRDSLQVIQAWFLCLKISRLINNNLYILQSISFIIEETNMDFNVINDLLIEAENLEIELTKFTSPEIWTVLTTYHINKSIMLFRHQNMQAGFKEYERALECFLNIGETEDELLEIRLDFLHTWYLQLPCALQMEGHDVFSLAKCSKVLSRITTYVKFAGNSSFAQSICFEVYQATAHMYRWMSLPREVRCYCRDIVTFAQRLVNPFQTAYFLIDLAHVDLLSTRLDDCQVKLSGLSDLLCLDNRTNNSLNKATFANFDNINKDIDVLVDNFSEIMLDCPATNYKYEGSSASPVLFIKPFKQPSFMKHSTDCDCFYCVSVEYKILVLEYINLEAQLLLFRGNTSAAQESFRSGLELYKYVTKDCSFEAKITKHLSFYPLRDLKDIFSKTVCALLLNYTNCLLLTNDIKTAELFNQKILKLLSKRKYEHFFIHNEALLQKYTITMSMCEETSASSQNYLPVNTECMKNTNEMPKTPENQQTKIIFTTCHSPRPNSPPKRRFRRIKCDFSDESETEKPSCSVTHSSKKKSAKKFDLLDKKNNKDSNTIKTIKNPKPVLQEIPPTPLPKIKLTNDKSESYYDNENTSYLIPSSPNAYTPNALQDLKSRTELLTKKLKKSSVKKTVTNARCNNALENGNTSNNCGNDRPVKENICKNLMSELCAAGTNISTKPSQKKKSRIISSAINERTDRVNTRRTARANSKAVNK